MGGATKSVRAGEGAAGRPPGPGRAAGRAAVVLITFILLPALFAPRPAAAAAAGAAGAARMVSLPEAYSLALASHEDVLVAGELVVQARSNLGRATSGMLPTVVAEGTYTKYTQQIRASGFLIQPDDATRVDLKVTQPLYAGGRKWYGRRRAMIGLEGSRVDHAAVKERVLLATAEAYYSVLKAERNVEIQEAAERRAGERLKVAAARLEAGEVTKADLLRAEAEAAGAEAALITARSALIDATDILKRFIGVAGEVSLVEPPAGEDVSAGVEDLLGTAYERRRDYRRRRLDEREAAEGVAVARGSFFPTLDFVGTYTHRDQHPTTSFLLEDSSSGSVVFTYPLFEGGLRRSEFSEARSKLREAELRRLALKRDIEVEVRDAYNELTALRAVLRSLARQVAFAREDYKMVFEQFKFGVATTVDVIDSDANLIEAESSLASARYDIETAKLRLRTATGVLFDELTAGKKLSASE